MRKRIGIIYSGGIRTNGLNPHYTADSHILDATTKYLLNEEFKTKYEYDVFISTDNIDIDKAIHYFGGHLKNIHLHPDYDENRRKDGIDWYLNEIENKIPSYEYFYNKYVTTTNFNGHMTKSSCLHEFYRLYSSYNLLKNYEKKTNTQYEYLVRLRLDSRLKQNLMPLFDYLEKSNKQIFVEHNVLCIVNYKLKNIFSAIKAYGRYQKPIDISSGIFSHLHVDPNALLSNLNQTMFCPDRQFMEHVNDVIIRNGFRYHEACIPVLYPSFNVLYRENGSYAHTTDYNIKPHETIESIKERYRIRNIHTFGDSHAIDGWNKIHDPVICKHHIGAILCYTIGINKENIFELNMQRWGLYNSIDYVDVQDNDMVIFSFGEIDCRCHIHKHVTKSFTYQQIIDNIIKNYFESIINVTRKYNNLRICIYNIVPTINKTNCVENPEYPFLGTDEERKAYILYFNQRLREMCNIYNFIFFDVYYKYADSNGYLNKELSDGNIHIRDPTYIKEFLLEILQDDFKTTTI